MAESTLSLSFTDLKAEVGVYLGYGATAANWTAGQLAEIERYVHAGCRQFYYPPAVEGQEFHEWSFLRPTGTVATVADDWDYALPDDFGTMRGNLYFSTADQHRADILLVSVAQILSMRQGRTDTGTPAWAAVRWLTSDGGTGQRHELLLYPTPDAVYTLSFEYEAFTGKLSAEKPYPLGGMKHSELLLESCLAKAEERAEDGHGVHWGLFMRGLIAAQARDRQHGPQHFGFMGDASGVSLPPHRRAATSHVITYNGEPI